MESEHVRLVVPEQYHGGYPPQFRDGIWTVKHFIGYVRETLRRG